MNPLILDECRSLFRDDDALETFVKAIRDRPDFTPIMLDDELIGALLSPTAAKEVLYNRLVHSCSANDVI